MIKSPLRRLSFGAACLSTLTIASYEAAAAKTSNPPSETRSFRDWTAVCDNLNTCTAYAPAADSNGFIMVKRAAGPQSRPQVVAGSWNLPSEVPRIRLDIDGRDYAPARQTRVDDEPILQIDTPSDQLLAAIANGRAMTLSAGGQSNAVTLKGAAAAFLWLDERQGRLGTTTALIRKGTRPASVVPAAPPAPRLTPAAPVAQTGLPKAMHASVSALPEVRECAEFNQGSSAIDEDWDVYRLGSNTLLWSIPCGSGAYNFSQIYVTSDNDGSAAVTITFPTSQEGEIQLVNSNFDPEANTLSAFSKGRGLGDCGQSATWTWTGQGFALLEENLMGDCLGIYPDMWPSTWRAQVHFGLVATDRKS